jgi:hypothetical protein
MKGTCCPQGRENEKWRKNVIVLNKVKLVKCLRLERGRIKVGVTREISGLSRKDLKY